MVIGYINFNKINYQEYGELHIEQIQSHRGLDALFINAHQNVLVEVKKLLKDTKVISMGFSPLGGKELFDFISFYCTLNDIKYGSVVYDFNEEVEINYFGDDLSRNVLIYINKNTRFECFYTALFFLKIYINSLTSGLLINKEKIINELEYDEFLLDFLSYKVVKCEYKDIRKGLSQYLNNKTVTKYLFDKSIENSKRGGKWSDFSNVMNEYINLVKSRNERALLFHYSYIISSATLNKNLKNSALAYSYLHRSIEVIALFFMLKKKFVYEDGGVILDSMTNKRVEGVSFYLNELKNLKLIDVNSDIFSILNIRNNSLLGHGLYLPELDKFDSIYLKLRDLERVILDVEEKDLIIKFSNVFKLHSKEESKSSFLF